MWMGMKTKKLQYQLYGVVNRPPVRSYGSDTCMEVGMTQESMHAQIVQWGHIITRKRYGVA